MSSRVLREKNLHARHLKGKHGKLYIVRKANKCRYRTKISIADLFNSAKENRKNVRENDNASFNQTNESIGYQNLADICEIWPERSLYLVKQKLVRDF